MSRLAGKSALVTGATGGIGEAVAKRFLEEGARVMIVGRSADKLEATRGRLADVGELAHFQADATDEQATADSIAAAVEAFGGLDIVVANAGTEGTLGPLESQTRENFMSVLETNVVGVWLTMKHSIAPLRKRGGGSIVAISSVAGVIGFPALGPYIASKHAVYGLVKTAALELAESGLRVNAIGPGPIDNRMMQSLADQIGPEDPSAVRGSMTDLIPMKRYGTNEEVANLALFLASDESSYSTGSIFMIDGGFTCG